MCRWLFVALPLRSLFYLPSIRMFKTDLPVFAALRKLFRDEGWAFMSRYVLVCECVCGRGQLVLLTSLSHSPTPSPARPHTRSPTYRYFTNPLLRLESPVSSPPCGLTILWSHCCFLDQGANKQSHGRCCAHRYDYIRH